MLISILSSADPLLRDLVSVASYGDVDVMTCDLTEDSVIIRVHRARDTSWGEEFASDWTSNSPSSFDSERVTIVPLPHACVTCSLRDGIVPVLSALADDGVERLLLALPVTIESINVVPRLNELMFEDPLLCSCQICSCVHVVNVDSAATDLLRHIPLSERGLQLIPGDNRCFGEIMMISLGYSDIVLAVGEDDLGSDLIEHLRPFDTLRINHLDDMSPDLLFQTQHDSDRAIERVHPATTSAWGGPTAHGVWTLDLHSSRPFHPLRLRKWVQELAGRDTCARGCFWLPSRPDMVCTWEANGGSASVGCAGIWDGPAFCHLIITGTGDESVRDEVRDAFSKILLTQDEFAFVDNWAGTRDGLDEWFPDES